MHLVTASLQSGHKDVIVDLGAQTDMIINHWLDESNVYDAAQELGIELYKWWVSDLDADSLKDISQLSETIPAVNHVLVRNIDCAKSVRWSATIASNQDLSKALSHNLKSIEFPRLRGTLVEDLRENLLTFEDVIAQDLEGLGMLERSAISKWLKRCEQEINQVYAFQEVPAMTKANSQS